MPRRRHRARALAVVVATLGSVMGAQADTCPVSFGDHTPCEIIAVAPAGGSASAQLRLRFFNFTGSSWFWVLYPADTSACLTPPPADHWASFAPFFGLVPSGPGGMTYDVDVTLSAAELTRGAYYAYACVDVNTDGIPIVAVPITFGVDDVIFADDFQ